MAKARVTETIARPTRSTIMLAIAVGGVSWYDDHVNHLSHRADALFGVSEYNLAIGVGLAAVSAVWVAVENKLGKGLLRQVPPTDAPVVDDDDSGVGRH